MGEEQLIYSGYSCTQGWFFTPCISDPSLRGLGNIVRMDVKTANCSEWEQVPIPISVRSIVALHLNNYASGRNPWVNLKPEYLEKRGYVQAHVDDGLIEIFGLKHGWHASMVMTELNFCRTHHPGCGHTIRVPRRRVEKSFSANGWRTMETANE